MGNPCAPADLIVLRIQAMTHLVMATRLKVLPRTRPQSAAILQSAVIESPPGLETNMVLLRGVVSSCVFFSPLPKLLMVLYDLFNVRRGQSSIAIISKQNTTN